MATTDQLSAPRRGSEQLMSRREVHARPAQPWRRWSVVALVGVLVVVVGGSALALWQLNANITKIDVSSAIGLDRPTQAAGTTGAVNLLLIGSDTRGAPTPTPTSWCTCRRTAPGPRSSPSPATR